MLPTIGAFSITPAVRLGCVRTAVLINLLTLFASVVSWHGAAMAY